MEEEPKLLRPDVMDFFPGAEKQKLTEDERAMQSLLIGKYKESGRSLVLAIQVWRAEHPKAMLGEAIQALYQIEEQK